MRAKRRLRKSNTCKRTSKRESSAISTVQSKSLKTWARTSKESARTRTPRFSPYRMSSTRWIRISKRWGSKKSRQRSIRMAFRWSKCSRLMMKFRTWKSTIWWRWISFVMKISSSVKKVELTIATLRCKSAPTTTETYRFHLILKMLATTKISTEMTTIWGWVDRSLKWWTARTSMMETHSMQCLMEITWARLIAEMDSVIGTTAYSFQVLREKLSKTMRWALLITTNIRIEQSLMTEWSASRDQATIASPIMITRKTTEALAENAIIDSSSTLTTTVETILLKTSQQKLKISFQASRLL